MLQFAATGEAGFVLNTLRKKPGAVNNSVALKSIPRLKAIFDTYYKNQPKKFIERFLENRELSIDEIIALFERETANKGEIDALDVVRPISQIVVSARAFVANYSVLVNNIGNTVNNIGNTASNVTFLTLAKGGEDQ
jgi:hypothetical protein